MIDKHPQPIGHIYKTHGTSGELTASFDAAIDPSELRCVIISRDGIDVPFFLDGIRPRGSEAFLIHIDGVDSETAASSFCDYDIYATADDIKVVATDDDTDDDGFYLADLVGYTISDRTHGTVGTVADWDDSTANLLLIVKSPAGKILYIPVADEYIASIDHDARTMEMDLPTGLLDL